MKFSPLDRPNSDQITSAIENNLISKVKYYPSVLPGMTVLEKSDLSLIDSQEPTSTFNIVCNGKFSEDQSQEKVQEVTEYYKSKNLPVCWWIGPSTQPKGLEKVLVDQGWTYEATDLGLAADLRKIEIKKKSIDQLEIVQVNDSKTMLDFARVLASFFGEFEKEAILNFYQKVAARGFDNSIINSEGFSQTEKDFSKDPLQNFVAYFEGRPVATSSFFLSHGVAGFYDCLTIPEMRRKGIGQAMMMKRFQYVLDLGISWVTLSSSHDSRGLYQRLGFQKYCEFSTFVKS